MLVKTLVILTLFSACFCWERLFPFAKEPRTSFWVNVSLGGLSFLATRSIFFLLFIFFPLRTIEPEAYWLLQVTLTLLVLDGVSYLWHRAAHKVRFLWILHSVHHSEDRMESTSAFRFHVLEVLLSLIPRYFAVFIFNFPLEGVLIFEVAFQCCNIFQHSNIKLPPFIEKILLLILVTPDMHRSHHSIDERRQNTHFSTLFSFWDRLLGTYQKNMDSKPFKLGLHDLKQSPSFLSLLFLK